MGGWCNDNWYVSIRYDNEWLSVLQPKQASCPQDYETKASDSRTEFGTIILLQQFLGFIFILLVLYRSCSPTKVDGYRLVFMYIIGTVAFVLGLVYGPSHGGFQRLVAFGVLLHNLAEWFIISRIWQGEQYLSAMPAILYVSIFAICITLIPLSGLFFIGMFQGACCDWILVLSFFVMMRWFKAQHKNKQYFEARFRYAAIGFSAALLHVLSIQPLFFGMALAYPGLVYVSSTLVVPTFVLYVWFASSHMRRVNLVNPQYGLSFQGYEIARAKMTLRAKEIELQARGEVEQDGKRTTRAYSELAQQCAPLYKQNILSAGIFPKLKTSNLMATQLQQNREMKEMGSDGDSDSDKEENKNAFRPLKAGIQNIDIYQHIIDYGFTHIGDEQQQAYMKSIMIKVFALGITMSLCNSFLVFFSPCYIDTKADC